MVSEVAAADLEAARDRERQLRDALAFAEAKERQLATQLAAEQRGVQLDSSGGDTTFGDAKSEFGSATPATARSNKGAAAAQTPGGTPSPLLTNRTDITDASGLLTDDDSQTGGAILAGLTGAAGGAASGSSLASTPLGGTPLTTPGGTPRSNSPLKGLNPSMGGVGPTAAGTGLGRKDAAKAKREAEKAAAALAEAKKKHAAELARLKADQAAAIAKASDKRAKELAAEHERKLEEMRQVHAADVEKRGGALKTTRVQLQETSAQVAKLRELHEKSAAEARTASSSCAPTCGRQGRVAPRRERRRSGRYKTPCPSRCRPARRRRTSGRACASTASSSSTKTASFASPRGTPETAGARCRCPITASRSRRRPRKARRRCPKPWRGRWTPSRKST